MCVPPKDEIQVRFLSGVPDKRCNRAVFGVFLFFEVRMNFEFLLFNFHPFFCFLLANRERVFERFLLIKMAFC